MLYAATTSKYVFDLKLGDIYWCDSIDALPLKQLQQDWARDLESHVLCIVFWNLHADGASSVSADTGGSFHFGNLQVHGGLRVDHGAQLPDVRSAAEWRHERGVRGHADAPHPGSVLGGCC